MPSPVFSPSTASIDKEAQCAWKEGEGSHWHYVQLTSFSIFVILVIVTAIIKIKIGKRSVHQREVLLQISYASAS
jgi:hypothetical protein